METMGVKAFFHGEGEEMKLGAQKKENRKGYYEKGFPILTETRGYEVSEEEKGLMTYKS